MSRPPAGIGEIRVTFGGFRAPMVVFNHRFRFPGEGRAPDQQDSYATAEWLRRADANGSLTQFMMPELEPGERKTAEIEGWILGVA